MTEDRVIGARGGLPWRLPSDLAHFKRTTLGHPVVMGRATWDSLERPLPGRTSIVLTRRGDLDLPDGVHRAGSLTEGLEIARQQPGADEVFVIGGGETFAEALAVADRIYLTVIHADIPGDTWFPELDPAEWTLADEARREADARNAHAHTFRRYDRSAR
jgi:dihydrofolate reductase